MRKINIKVAHGLRKKKKKIKIYDSHRDGKHLATQYDTQRHVSQVNKKKSQILYFLNKGWVREEKRDVI